MASSAAVELLNDMVEQVIYGDGNTGAAALAQKASATTRAAAAEQADVRLMATAYNDAEEKSALQTIKSMLASMANTASASPVLAKAGGGWSTTTYVLAGGGLALAAWFLFFRKK
jgi:hypothetical protein